MQLYDRSNYKIIHVDKQSNYKNYIQSHCRQTQIKVEAEQMQMINK